MFPVIAVLTGGLPSEYVRYYHEDRTWLKQGNARKKEPFECSPDSTPPRHAQSGRAMVSQKDSSVERCPIAGGVDKNV